jgi:hypothetical protein
LLIARGLFKLASIGIKPGPTASVVANDPTEFALASVAEHIFGELAPEYRRRFRQVPDVLSGLRAHAHVLRQRASRDAGATRSRERLALVVAALENIRLDLLRLKAGTTTAEALTADLEAAEEVSRQVNADIEGVREAGALLSRP